MSNHLLNILFNQEYSDADIVSKEGLVVPVHKAIICSQSPILKAMFDSKWNSEERPTGFIPFDIETLARALFFFYTGTSSSLQSALITCLNFHFATFKKDDAQGEEKDHKEQEDHGEEEAQGEEEAKDETTNSAPFKLSSSDKDLTGMIKLYEIADYLQFRKLKYRAYEHIKDSIDEFWGDAEGFAAGLKYAYGSIARDDDLLCKVLERKIINASGCEKSHTSVRKVFYEQHAESKAVVCNLMKLLDFYKERSRRIWEIAEDGDINDYYCFEYE